VGRRAGVEQASTYVREIERAAGEIASGKLRSRPLDFVSTGLRMARHVRHFIYFRQRDGGIAISRVLHDRRDETIH